MVHKRKILKKTEKDDTSCLDDLIRSYYPDIFRYCLWHTPNRQTAEDAVQETFLKIVRYFRQYVHSGKFKSYIYKVASNVCVDIWRKKSTESLPEDLSYMETGFQQTEFDVDLRGFVEKLPEKYREIVLLRFAQDLSMREIADIENVPLRTVQSRLRAALKQIREDIEGR
ncbi:RNA polymerase sigma factor [Clostridium sp. JNZ X4-2]